MSGAGRLCRTLHPQRFCVFDSTVQGVASKSLALSGQQNSDFLTAALKNTGALLSGGSTATPCQVFWTFLTIRDRLATIKSGHNFQSNMRRTKDDQETN